MEKTNNTPASEMAKMLEPMPEAKAETGAFEIAPGITSEEMRAMFFDAESLVEPPYRVWQLNSKGHRYYYRFNEAGEPEFYPSVTTILSQTLPMSPFLLKWITDKGLEEAERYKGERAAYGTYMHKAFEELIINRSYDLDNLKTDLCAYVEANRLPGDFIYYADDLKKDILAFAQFVKDYDVRPYAVEIALVHPWRGYAGLIDMPCSMLAKPGNEERINAIVDFKSGRKGFWEENEIQLHLYKDLWNANFEDMRIERVFNFAPKDWRKKPTYTLKEQTDSPNAKKIPALLALSQIEDEKRDDVFTFITGRVDLDGECDLSDNYTSMTLAEVVKSRTEESAPEAGKAVTVGDLKPEPEQKKQMTCSEFEVTINDVAPYSLWEVTDIAKVNGVELVEKGLNLDEHRWYSIATNIYKCSDGYVKVTGAYESFSEVQTWKDINVFSEAEKLQGKELQAFELRMKAYEIENAPEAGKGVAEDDLRQEEREMPEKPKKRAKSGGKDKGKVSNAGKGKSAGNGPKKAKNEPKQTESVPKTRKSGPKAVKSEPEEAKTNDLLNEEVEL